MIASLWQILVKFSQPAPNKPLTCDECFNLLEYLADRAVAGADLVHLHDVARQHLGQCATCHEHHLQKLEELEV